jgi:hypothetical protein
LYYERKEQVQPYIPDLVEALKSAGHTVIYARTRHDKKRNGYDIRTKIVYVPIDGPILPAGKVISAYRRLNPGLPNIALRFAS